MFDIASVDGQVATVWVTAAVALVVALALILFVK